MANQLRFIKNLIYKLKRAYGFPIDFYRLTSTSVDRVTGVKNQVRQVYHINRAIELPSDITRIFQFSRDYMLSNRAYTYGGLFDVDKKTIIIDHRDLPKGVLPLTLNDWAVYKHVRYEFKSIDSTEESQSSLIVMRAQEGALPSEIIEVKASDNIRFIQTAGGTKL